ncbi:MAG TPA: hypothetical protein VKV22_07035 [Rhodanobacteraceae bacterium]|nr:hypothetical protein [Rhodanobacteraceae bacterium]
MSEIRIGNGHSHASLAGNQNLLTGSSARAHDRSSCKSCKVFAGNTMAIGARRFKSVAQAHEILEVVRQGFACTSLAWLVLSF